MTAFRHILVPIDGSAISRCAIAPAVKLARALGARITAAYVVPEGVPTVFTGGRIYASPALGRQHRALIRLEAERVLSAVERAARAERVPYSGARVDAKAPWLGILALARARRCDLIVMSSHGRSGVKALLLGSQTAKVLVHSGIPVLVCPARQSS